MAGKRSSKTIGSTKKSVKKKPSPPAKYPRHAADKSLRIPSAILEQNAGKPCSVREAAEFVGVGFNGPFQVEVSSGIKFGFLERPNPGQIVVTERAKRALRPQSPEDRLDAMRSAVMGAPVISAVYGHYRASVGCIKAEGRNAPFLWLMMVHCASLNAPYFLNHCRRHHHQQA